MISAIPISMPQERHQDRREGLGSELRALWPLLTLGQRLQHYAEAGRLYVRQRAADRQLH